MLLRSCRQGARRMGGVQKGRGLRVGNKAGRPKASFVYLHCAFDTPPPLPPYPYPTPTTVREGPWCVDSALSPSHSAFCWFSMWTAKKVENEKGGTVEPFSR